MCAMLSLMAFLLVAAPKTKGALPVDSLGGTGIFTAILVAIYCVEMMRFLKAHNIGIRLPDQVPPMIKNSFDLLIPVLVVVLTLYPLSLLIQSQFGIQTAGLCGRLAACDPAGGADWPPAVVCRDPRRGDCLRDAANVLADKPGGEPDRAGGEPAFATHLYGSLLDVLYRYRRIGGDDGAGVLLSA